MISYTQHAILRQLYNFIFGCFSTIGESNPKQSQIFGNLKNPENFFCFLIQKASIETTGQKRLFVSYNDKLHLAYSLVIKSKIVSLL